jgi:hypothetical protein
MLRPNEKFRDHNNVLFAVPGRLHCAFWDHNLELTIGFQELGLVARGMRWGWEWGLHKAQPSHTHIWDKQPCLLRPNPAAHHPTHVNFPLIPFRGSGTGHSCCHVWLAALDVCQALSMDSPSYGRHFHCAQGPASLCTMHMFVFPPPLVGVDLWRVWHSCSFSEGAFASASA